MYTSVTWTIRSAAAERPSSQLLECCDETSGIRRSCKTGPECHRNTYTGTLSGDARLDTNPTRSLGVI